MAEKFPDTYGPYVDALIEIFKEANTRQLTHLAEENPELVASVLNKPIIPMEDEFTGHTIYQYPFHLIFSEELDAFEFEVKKKVANDLTSLGLDPNKMALPSIIYAIGLLDIYKYKEYEQLADWMLGMLTPETISRIELSLKNAPSTVEEEIAQKMKPEIFRLLARQDYLTITQQSGQTDENKIQNAKTNLYDITKRIIDATIDGAFRLPNQETMSDQERADRITESVESQYGWALDLLASLNMIKRDGVRVYIERYSKKPKAAEKETTREGEIAKKLEKELGTRTPVGPEERKDNKKVETADRRQGRERRGNDKKDRRENKI
jgi:hypothetical protein